MEFARLLRMKFIEAIRDQENALEIERLYDRCVGATAMEIASDRSKIGGSFTPTLVGTATRACVVGAEHDTSDDVSDEPTATVPNLYQRYLESRGSGAFIWDTPEAKEYIENLRKTGEEEE